MVAPVVRYPLVRARWRSQSKVTQRRGTLIAVAVFIAVYMVSLYLSSGTARAAAGAGRAVTAPPTEHIIYTSDEGPPLCSHARPGASVLYVLLPYGLRVPAPCVL